MKLTTALWCTSQLVTCTSSSSCLWLSSPVSFTSAVSVFVTSFFCFLSRSVFNFANSWSTELFTVDNHVYHLLGYSLESLDLLAFQLFLDSNVNKCYSNLLIAVTERRLDYQDNTIQNCYSYIRESQHFLATSMLFLTSLHRWMLVYDWPKLH